jgi:hypothetical protein
LQAHSACKQLKQQLLHMDRDLSKAGEKETETVEQQQQR